MKSIGSMFDKRCLQDIKHLRIVEINDTLCIYGDGLHMSLYYYSNDYSDLVYIDTCEVNWNILSLTGFDSLINIMSKECKAFDIKLVINNDLRLRIDIMSIISKYFIVDAQGKAYR